LIDQLADGRKLEVEVKKSTGALYVAHFSVGGRVLVMLTYRPAIDGVTIRAKRLAGGDMRAASDFARLLREAILLGTYIEVKVAVAAEGPTIQ
jgi:hypothetical protein